LAPFLRDADKHNAVIDQCVLPVMKDPMRPIPRGAS
jgi:hypothetical protein